MDPTNWLNKSCALYVEAVTPQLASPPKLWNIPGGVAIWDLDINSTQNFLSSGLPICFKRVMVKDEVIAHNCPVQHNDFVYVYLPLVLTPDSLDKISKISSSVGYDKMNNMLTVRCGSLEMDIIIAKIVLDVLLGKTTLSRLYKDKTYVTALSKYNDAQYVMSCYQELWSSLATHYTEIVRAGFSLSQGYWNSQCGPERPQQGGSWFSGFWSQPKRQQPDPAGLANTQSLIAKMTSLVVPTKMVKSKKIERMSEDEYSVPWYASNSAYIQRIGWDSDMRPYQIYTPSASVSVSKGPSRAAIQSGGSPGMPYQPDSLERKQEFMVGAGIPEDPWYTSDDPLTFGYGAYDSQTYLPPHRDALLAQSELTMSGLREQFSTGPCRCKRRCRCWEKMTGDKTAGASAFDDSYKVTDPRFLFDTATLHFNVDSDTQDITREYGTVAQKKHYPRLADFFQYGIASTVDPF